MNFDHKDTLLRPFDKLRASAFAEATADKTEGRPRTRSSIRSLNLWIELCALRVFVVTTAMFSYTDDARHVAVCSVVRLD
jgi:hypothetical protein